MASNRVKGITIDINGNTTDLQKSLQGVDKQLQNTQRQLQDVNKLLKLDPKNVELMEQKQRLLGDAVAQTKQKLETLQTAAKNADEALKSGAMTQEQYDGLQREIAETESKLKDLEKEAKDAEKATSNIGKAADALGKVASKAEETGKALTKHVTTPLVAIGGAAIAAFNDVDNGMDIIIKKTGATGAELEDLEKVYENIFGSMPVTAEQAGNAVGEVATRFNATGQNLEDLTKLFLQFAEITDSDVESSVASVDKIMTKFGIDSSNTSSVLGIMTRASQTSGISIDTLTSALESNGASFKEMGFDLAESVNLLTQFEENGVDTTTALAALKKEVINSTKAGTDAQSELRSRIEAIKNATSETEALQIATEIFGGKGAPEMTQAIREGRVSVDDLSDSLSNYGTVVTDTFEATQDPPDEAKIAFNNLKLAGAELGASILSVLQPAISGLASALKDVKDWYDKLDPSVQTIITTVLLLVAALGPLLIVIAKVIVAVKTILTVLPAVKAAILAVNAALAANPIALVIIAITALIAIFVALWNNCESFREFWINLWEALKEGAETVIEGIQTAFEQLGEGFSAIGEGIMLLFDSIGSTFEALGDTLGTVAGTITDGFQTMADTVGGIFEGMWNVIKGVINTIIGGVNGMIAGIEGGLNAVIGALNTLHWEIPSWVPGLGGYGFGFDIPKASFGRIPELATGAVIQPNSPFLAMLGDQRSGVNIEAPLQTIKDALIEAMNQRGGTGTTVIPVYIGQEKIDTVVARANRNNNYISGGR